MKKIIASIVLSTFLSLHITATQFRTPFETYRGDTNDAMLLLFHYDNKVFDFTVHKDELITINQDIEIIISISINFFADKESQEDIHDIIKMKNDYGIISFPLIIQKLYILWNCSEEEINTTMQTTEFTNHFKPELQNHAFYVLNLPLKIILRKIANIPNIRVNS